MDVNGDRNGDFSLMAMTNVEAGTYEVRRNYNMVTPSPTTRRRCAGGNSTA